MVTRRRMASVGLVCILMVGLAPRALAQDATDQGMPAWLYGPYTPPPCTVPIFNDVPCSNYFSAWINQLYNDQVSTGCPYPNFCPDQPVTRGQMAAFLERAMRGTSNWPPHVAYVWAVKNADGTPNTMASGQALIDAITSIPWSGGDAPSDSNPWLVKVGPGVFDLGNAGILLPAYVSMVGDGVSVTRIRGTTLGSFHLVLSQDGNNEIASLTLNGVGGGTDTRTLIMAHSTRLTHLRVLASGGSVENYAIWLQDTDVHTLTDVEAVANGGTYAAGLLVTGTGTTVFVRGGSFTASGGSDVDAAILVNPGTTVHVFNAILNGTAPVQNAGTVTVAGSQLIGGAVNGAVTCAGVYDETFTFFSSTCP